MLTPIIFALKRLTGISAQVIFSPLMLRIRLENQLTTPTYIAFIAAHPELCKPVSIPGITKVIRLSEDGTASIVRKYYEACKDASIIYNHIAQSCGDDVVIEVSMDETDEPQTPPELLVILGLLADAKIPVQTVAPKFTGRFNKGVDYVGDLAQFEQEFSDDVAVCAFAVKQYGLPADSQTFCSFRE